MSVLKIIHGNDKQNRDMNEFISDIGDDLSQIEFCLRQISDIAGGTRAYWEGEASAEHQAGLNELTNAAGQVMKRMYSVCSIKGDMVETQTVHALPDDIL